MKQFNLNDPFRVEEYRDFLAKNKLLDQFIKTYSENFPSLKNLNSSNFWDKIFLDKEENFKSPIVKDKIKDILNFIKTKRGKILDVGIGSGFIEKEILKKNHEEFSFYGIDISDVAISKVRKQLTGEFTKGLIQNIPYKDNYFDVILCLEVLEHINPSETFKALSELYRTLKEKGILIISVPLNEGLEELYKSGQNPSGHVRTYSKNIIDTELKIVGFNNFVEKYFYAFKNFYILKNFLSKFFFKNRWLPNDLLVIARKR